MMQKIVLRYEFDFAMLRKLPCENCRKPFDEHFQPSAAADPKLAANWCPAGRGFSSRAFKRPKLKPMNQEL